MSARKRERGDSAAGSSRVPSQHAARLVGMAPPAPSTAPSTPSATARLGGGEAVRSSPQTQESPAPGPGGVEAHSPPRLFRVTEGFPAAPRVGDALLRETRFSENSQSLFERLVAQRFFEGNGESASAFLQARLAEVFRELSRQSSLSTGYAHIPGGPLVLLMVASVRYLLVHAVSTGSRRIQSCVSRLFVEEMLKEALGAESSSAPLPAFDSAALERALSVGSAETRPAFASSLMFMAVSVTAALTTMQEDASVSSWCEDYDALCQQMGASNPDTHRPQPLPPTPHPQLRRLLSTLVRVALPLAPAHASRDGQEPLFDALAAAFCTEDRRSTTSALFVVSWLSQRWAAHGTVRDALESSLCKAFLGDAEAVVAIHLLDNIETVARPQTWLWVLPMYEPFYWDELELPYLSPRSGDGDAVCYVTCDVAGNWNVVGSVPPAHLDHWRGAELLHWSFGSQWQTLRQCGTPEQIQVLLLLRDACSLLSVFVAGSHDTSLRRAMTDALRSSLESLKSTDDLPLVIGGSLEAYRSNAVALAGLAQNSPRAYWARMYQARRSAWDLLKVFWYNLSASPRALGRAQGQSLLYGWTADAKVQAVLAQYEESSDQEIVDSVTYTSPARDDGCFSFVMAHSHCLVPPTTSGENVDESSSDAAVGTAERSTDWPTPISIAESWVSVNPDVHDSSLFSSQCDEARKTIATLVKACVFWVEDGGLALGLGELFR